MKLFYILILFIFFQSCSFDNKSGIWKNKNITNDKNDDLFKDFENLASADGSFNKIISIKNDFKFKLTNPINNLEWKEIFYNQSNNFDNFQYNNSNQLIFKSKKLSKFDIQDFILFEDNNAITSDKKGNIIIFSVNQNKIISKFNFYKKKYKKITKHLNIIVQNNVIYVTDNIGFMYAFDYKENKILWAKKNKVPFSSNLKISGNKLIAANQNNYLYFININNGDILSLIPTEETTIKNEFKNNISSNKNVSLFLNTYGSLYAIENKNMKIKWFLNLNQSIDINPSNLFLGNQILINDRVVVLSSNQFTYVIDINNGSIIHRLNLSTSIKPIINNSYIFAITKNSLLVGVDLNTGKIIYSYRITEKLAEFLKIKEGEIEFKNIMLVNNKIFIFLKNSFLLKFNINGELEAVNKLSSKLNTHPIFIDKSMLYLDKKNRLSIID
jgi:outer membrane protein assembly factor BamB